VLRLGQPRQAVQHRGAQLVRHGEGKLQLRLDARSPYYPQVRGCRGDVVEKRTRRPHGGGAVIMMTELV